MVMKITIFLKNSLVLKGFFLKKPFFYNEKLILELINLVSYNIKALRYGPIVKWDNVSFASLSSEFDSPWVHHLAS